MMKYILWFLGLIGAILILILFIKIKVRVVYNELEAFVQLNYSFFSYKMDLKDKVDALADNIQDKAKSTFHETVDNIKDTDPLKDVVLEKEEQLLKVSSEDKAILEEHKISTVELKAESVDKPSQPVTFKQPSKQEEASQKPNREDRSKLDSTREKGSWLEKLQQFKANRERQKIKKRAKQKKEQINERIDKIQLKEKREKLMLSIKQYKIYIEVGLRILDRMVRRLQIHKLLSHLTFNVEDPMLNGCLLGVAWAINANVYRFIQTHVLVVKDLDFDVQTQFSGNNIFMKFECIISVRLADIILVLLLSLKDLLIVRKTYKMKEDMI